MFRTIRLSICTLMHLYVSWRLYSIPFVKPHVPPRTFIPASILLSLILLPGRVYGQKGTGSLAYTIELSGMNRMAALFLTFLPLLVIDVVTLFGLILHRMSALLRGLALIAGLTLSAVVLVQGTRLPVIVKRGAGMWGPRTRLWCPGEITEVTLLVGKANF